MSLWKVQISHNSSLVQIIQGHSLSILTERVWAGTIGVIPYYTIKVVSLTNAY